MTKNFLLAAASVVALGFAGAASAADLTVTLPGGGTVVSTTAANARDLYTIASEAEGVQTGEITITATYVDPLPDANNLLVTFTLGGGATFSEAVSSANLTGFTNRTVSAGGAAGGNSVTFLVSTPTAATGTRDAVALTTDISFAAGNQPSAQVNTRTEAGTPIEGGNALPSALTFVDYASFISVETDPAATAVLTTASGFNQFAGGTAPNRTASLGTFTVELNDEVFTDFEGNTADADSFDSAELTIQGSTSGLTFTVANADSTGAAATVRGNVITIQEAGEYQVNANIATRGTPNTSNYNLIADIDLSTDFDDQDNVQVGPLASIVRQGTSVVVPWVASGSLSASNNTRNVVRVSNSDDSASGLVYLEVVTASGAQGTAPSASPDVVSTGMTIPAGGDLQITSQMMQDVLGDFRRGDIRITVEGEASDLIFRSRVVQPDGTFEEITLEPETGVGAPN